MLRNYLKIALRNLFRNKIYSFINIFGLSVGIAFCILIYLFVRNEWSYDTFHKNARLIYRAAVFENYSEQQQYFNTVTPFPLAQALEQNFPEVQRCVRIADVSDLVRQGEITFPERYHLVDPDFLEVFSFPLLQGEPESVLRTPNSVVLTEEMSKKYFGIEDPIGKTLSIKFAGGFQDFLITGIARNVPINSSIQFDFLLSFERAKELWGERMRKNWFNVIPETYVQVQDGVRGMELERKLPSLVKQIMGERYKEGAYILRLQPLTTIHLDTSYPSGIEPTSDPANSYVLAGIALLVLLIACINFMTLSIGRSVSRSREVGVRKVVGAVRSQLMRQFWGEAVLLSFFSLFLGIGTAVLLMPTFNSLANKNLHLAFDVTTFFVLLGLMGVVGFIAGSYPAGFLSAFKPVEVLKGKERQGNRNFLSHGLVVVQFALSIFLMISTIVMSEQLHFLRGKNLGYNSEQVVVITTNSNPQEGMRLVELFRNDLGKKTGIIQIAGSIYTFGAGWETVDFHTDDGIFREFYLNRVDHDFLDTLGIELAAGRNFSKDFPSDLREAVIVNEAFAEEFNWQSPIGERLPGRRFPTHRVIGVVKDFNFESLHDPIRPMMLVLDFTTIYQGIENHSVSSSRAPKIFVRIKPDNIPQTIALLKDTWEKIAPNVPFNFSFLDDDVDRLYRTEERWGKIVNYSSFFAILIACLGLFGLASLTITRRTKEICIRKVLGSSEAGVIRILCKDFAKLVLIANIIAWPVAYYAMYSWLEGFAFRTSIGLWIFFLAAALAFVIALATVSFQAVKAALINPVDGLRYE